MDPGANPSASLPVLFGVLLFGAVLPTLWTLHRVGPAMSKRLSRSAIAGGALAATALACGLVLEPGIAAGALSLPWLGMTVIVVMSRTAEMAVGRRSRALDQVGLTIATAFLAFGAANAAANRFGFEPLGFSPTIVLLTAIHFHAAGFVLLTAGILAYRRQPSRRLGSAIVLTIVGTMTTALGYALAPALIGLGALAVGLGGLGIAAATLEVRRRLRRPASRLLGLSAGIGLLVTMPLAIAYAAGTAFAVGWIDLDAMIRTHGVLNVVAVAVPISLTWAFES